MMASSTSNPTALRIGHAGELNGQRWTVLGRVALCSDDGYAWQEFYLGNEAGETTTLVWEDGEWKLFKELDSVEKSLSVADAKQRRVGDTVVVDGGKAEVDYVGSSRVTHIEGRAPAGVEVGDRANYFNARQGNGMLVVSWTGDELEVFYGWDLGYNVVEEAFGLPKRSRLAGLGISWSSINPNHLIGGVLVVVVVILVVAQIYDEIAEPPVPPNPPAKVLAPAARLPDRAVGTFQGHTYTVGAHAVVEIARPGRTFDRHEYVLTDETGGRALLVQGLNAKPGEWHLFTPTSLPVTFTPFDVAQIRAGKVTTAEGKPSEVVYIFQSKARDTEGAAQLRAWPDEVQYGFVVRTPDHWVLTRWTERELRAYRGMPVGTKELDAAFHLPAETPGRP